MSHPGGKAPGPEGLPVICTEKASTELSTSEVFFLDIYKHLQSKAEEEVDRLAHLLNINLLVTTPQEDRHVHLSRGITDMNWRQLIDPDLPTIAIRAETSVTETVKYVQASQQLRHEGEALFNMVILPSSVYGKESEVGGVHHAERGILIDRFGRIYVGDFPEPLPLDVINGHGLSPELEYAPEFINTPAQESLLYDKQRTKEEVLAGISHTETLAVWHKGESVEDLLALCKEYDKVVVKPLDASGGRGVILFDAATDDEEVFSKQIVDLTADYESVLIEKWQKGIPVEHPESGAQLSADVRAVVAGKRLVGMYARISPLGAPSNIATGSQAWTIEQLCEQAGLTPEQAVTLRKKIGAQALAFAAAAGTNMLGTSSIISPELEPVLIEGDGERMSALNSMSTLEDPADSLALYKEVLRGWHENMIVQLQTGAANTFRDGPQQSVFFPEDAADELFFHAKNISSLEDVRYFRTTVERISGATDAGEQLHPALLNLVTLASEVVAPGEYVASAHPSVDEMLRLGRAAMSEGDVETAVTYFNTAAERTWHTPRAQKRIANALVREDDLAMQHTALLGEYGSEDRARAFARTLYTHALTRSELDPLGISRSTTKLIQDTLTSYLLAPAENRLNLYTLHGQIARCLVKM